MTQTDIVFDTADEFIFGTAYDIVGGLLGYQPDHFGEIPLFDTLFDTFYQTGCQAVDVITSFFEHIYDGMDDLAWNTAFDYAESFGASPDSALFGVVFEAAYKNLLHAEEERGITY